MGHVQINLFGSFHVERDGKSVDEQLARSPKGMLLMQYLILAPRQTVRRKCRWMCWNSRKCWRG